MSAVEERRRNVQERASSRPPPWAWECMAAMEGMGRVERVVRVARRAVRKERVLEGEGRG